MLLYQQDKISQLEEKLETLDQHEQKALFHGSWRRGANPERKAVPFQLETALAEYGMLAKRWIGGVAQVIKKVGIEYSLCVRLH
jgi:hypothetical protein